MYKEVIRIGVLAILVCCVEVKAQRNLEGTLADAAAALDAGSEARAWDLVKANEGAGGEKLVAASPKLAVWVAEQYRKQRRLDDALGVCQAVLHAGDRVAPEDRARAMLVKGDVFKTQQNYVAARLEYKSLEENSALSDTPAGQEARFRNIDILRRTGDFEAAMAIIERLMDMPGAETRANAYYQRAHIAFDQEMYDEAREFIEIVKELKPDHIENLFLEARLNLLADRLQDPELEVGSRVLSTYVVPGRAISLKMHDRNLAVIRGKSGIPIVITTSRGNDREEVHLLASQRDSTLFRASVPSVLGAAEPGNSTVEVSGDDVVEYIIDPEFQRLNGLAYSAKQMVVVSDGELTASSGEWTSMEERNREALARQMARAVEAEGKLQAYERVRDTSLVRPGNPVYIQVVDYDRSLSGARDTVHVVAKSSSGDSVEGIELTETEPFSGVFRGALDTSTAPPRAMASDTDAGSDVQGPLSTMGSGLWASQADGEQGKWYEVDLIAAHPIETAALDLSAETGVTRASLYAHDDTMLRLLATTHPPDEWLYGYVDLAGHFAGGAAPEQTAAYVYTEVDGGSGGPAVFKIGSCDGVVCWLNGEQVHKNLGGRIWKPEEDGVQVTLKPGVNAILMRVSQLTGPWGVSLSIYDAGGDGLASLGNPAPVQDGVVTKWHVFDRLTPESIRVSERVSVHKPVRIGEETFKWVEKDLTRPAAMRVDGNRLSATFNDATGVRVLRWVFESFSGRQVAITGMDVKNRFNEQVVPVDTDYARIAANRLLELGPGDTIEITYRDDRRVREDELLYAVMEASFFNATISLAYDKIAVGRQGERTVWYDPAFRYRAGEADRLAIRVVDYDADITESNDTVRVLVDNAKGDRLWLTATETEAHSGQFLAILRLGETTGGETIATGQDVWIRASYSDRENSDGIIARSARVAEAPDDPPELQLYRTVSIPREPGATDESGQPLSPELKVSLAKSGGTAPSDPIVTSLESAIRFSVLHPAVALSQGSTVTAMAAVGPDGEPQPVTMRLSDSELGQFTADIPLRVGNEDAYTELEEGTKADVKPLYVVGGDLVHVSLPSQDGSARLDGWFTVATDGNIRFTDDKYAGPGVAVHAGDFVYLAVRDLDMDVTEGLDNVNVMLKGRGKPVEITLRESLPHSGIFTGRIKTNASTNTIGEAGVEDAFQTVDIAFGGRLEASYVDQRGVTHTDPLPVIAGLDVHMGADGDVIGFTKRFAEEDIAVRTRLLTAEALFEMAKDYRETEQTELADESLAEGRQILEEAIVDYPHTKHAPHAEFLLANLSQEMEEYKLALARYNKVLSTWPDSKYAAKSQLKKGICLEKSGDAENAMDAYVELTYTYPSSELVSDAVIRLGQHFYRVGRYDVSGLVFRRFQEGHPEHQLAPKVLFIAGQSFLKGSKAPEETKAKRAEYLQEAIDSFSHLIDAYDDKDLLAEALYWLADAHMEAKQLREAYMAFQRLTFDYPESKWAKFARGRLAQNAAAFEKAIEKAKQ